MKRILGIVVAVVVALGSGAYLGYEAGLSANNSFETIKFMVLVQEQHQCLEKSDMECARKVNGVMAGVVAAQFERTDYSGLSDDDKKAIQEYQVQRIEGAR